MLHLHRMQMIMKEITWCMQSTCTCFLHTLIAAQNFIIIDEMQNKMILCLPNFLEREDFVISKLSPSVTVHNFSAQPSTPEKYLTWLVRHFCTRAKNTSYQSRNWMKSYSFSLEQYNFFIVTDFKSILLLHFLFYVDD